MKSERKLGFDWAERMGKSIEVASPACSETERHPHGKPRMLWKSREK